MARPAGMAGAKAQSSLRFDPGNAEAGGTECRGTARQSAFTQRENAGGGKTWMNRSRRKNWNRLEAALLARWIVLTGFFALTGLIYVYLTIQLYHLGDRKKALENELASLRTQNDVANVQIAALTSRSALHRPLKEGYLKMIPISEHNIVRLTLPARPEEDAIQPVVNQGGGR